MTDALGQKHIFLRQNPQHILDQDRWEESWPRLGLASQQPLPLDQQDFGRIRRPGRHGQLSFRQGKGLSKQIPNYFPKCSRYNSRTE